MSRRDVIRDLQTNEVIPEVLVVEAPFYLTKYGPVYIIIQTEEVIPLLKTFTVFLSYFDAVAAFSKLIHHERLDEGGVVQ